MADNPHPEAFRAGGVAALQAAADAFDAATTIYKFSKHADKKVIEEAGVYSAKLRFLASCISQE